jgi:hypothetical protein
LSFFESRIIFTGHMYIKTNHPRVLLGSDRGRGV